MSHTIHEKTKLINRIRRLRGQMEAIERAIEEEKGCATVLQLIAGVRGAIGGLMSEVMEDHIDMHVADVSLSDKDREKGAAELIDVIRAYLK